MHGTIIFFLLIFELSSVNLVDRFPSLIVPPKFPEVCSGMSTTTGCTVSGSISVVWAFSSPKTFRENSITADCNPKQIPRNGLLVVRQNLQAAIFPSIPLFPNPPGTITPLKLEQKSTFRLKVQKCF